MSGREKSTHEEDDTAWSERVKPKSTRLRERMVRSKIEAES